MAILYGAKNVDEKYSPIFEPNLFSDVIFRPGVSFTDKYSIGPAGAIYVHKAGIADIAVGSPGANFTDVDVADELIPILLDKAFRRSRKIFEAQSNATAGNLESNELATASKEIGQAWQLQYNGCLPILLEENNTYYIPKMMYHRLIKGYSNLKVKINVKL